MDIVEAVGVAIINKEKQVLIAKRKEDKPMPNKWEFPGGKLEEDESLEECGVREIKEELDLDVVIDSYLGAEDIHYRNRDFRLHLYTAHLKDEEQNYVLHEHSEAVWVEFSEFGLYDFPAYKLSFIKPLLKILQKD